MKTYTYPVDARHSTVLSYAATSKLGAALWTELDWRGVRRDSGRHWLNPQGGDYLHVRCHYSESNDGPRRGHVRDRRWYRVRCRHRIGSLWRGGFVANVHATRRGKKWFWIVSVEKDNELN